MSGVDVVVGGRSATAEDVADMFWSLDSEQMADFFARLEDVAGIKLCFQMACVINEIADRAQNGDRRAQNGFQTMLSHASGYVESAIGFRSFDARMALDRLAARATGGDA